MFKVAEIMTRPKLWRHAAMVAVVVPAGILAACSHEEPPPPQPVVAPAPAPEPAPAPPPPPQGERG